VWIGLRKGRAVMGAQEELRTIRRRRWKRRLIVYPLAYLSLASVLYFGGCADRLVLFPSTGAIPGHGATERIVRTRDGQIQVWVDRSREARNRDPDAFVLEFTGNASRAERVAWLTAQRWNDHAVEVWAVNYPGYGSSTGPATLARIAKGAIDVYDEMARVAGDRPIYITGTSLGTTAALHVAVNRKVAGVVLHNPVPLRHLILRRHGWWNLWLIAMPIALQIPPELDAIENARRLQVPAVVLTADRDEVVPRVYQEMVIDAIASEKRVISLDNSSHNDSIEGMNRIRDLHAAIAWMIESSRTPPRTPAR
jgi:pimeloyl-ACP methyl ester carboxylesterase